jgi:hypothetical protein
MNIKLALLGLLIFLAGCAQLTPVGKAYKNNDACYVEITRNPHVQRVDRELIPDSKTDPEIRYKLLNSTDRIQEDQKQSLGIYIMLVQQCQSQFVIALSGTRLMEPWKRYFMRKNSQMNLLLKGDITVGEFNTALDVDSKQFGIELKKTYDVMVGESAIDQMNAARMFGNPAPLYIAPSTPANRGIVTLGDPPPAYVPPVQTICQPNGVGGFSCTSR